MAKMTGIVIIKLDSKVIETEPGSVEIDFGGEVSKTKPSPATKRANYYSEFMPGKLTCTAHHTTDLDIEEMRKKGEMEVVFRCKDTKREWSSMMCLAESIKLQDQGRGMPLSFEGNEFVQTSAGA
jgi:hypothetical protein